MGPFTHMEMVTIMAEKFVYPDFSTGDIELCFKNNEVCIYATDKGLEKLISFCDLLRKKKEIEHLHLEDYAVLTETSLTGVIVRL